MVLQVAKFVHCFYSLWNLKYFWIKKEKKRHPYVSKIVIKKFCIFQRLAALLYEAGRECGYVNYGSLQEILGVSERQAHLGTFPKGFYPHKIWTCKLFYSL